MTYDLHSPLSVPPMFPPAVVRLGPWSIAGLGADPGWTIKSSNLRAPES